MDPIIVGIEALIVGAPGYIAYGLNYIASKDPKGAQAVLNKCLLAEADLKAIEVIDPAHKAMLDNLIADIDKFKVDFAAGKVTAADLIDAGEDILEDAKYLKKMLPKKAAPAPAAAPAVVSAAK